MPTSEPSRGWSECRCREGRHLSLETEATPTPATATWSWRRTRNKSQSQLLLSSLCECLKAFFLFFCHLVSHMLLTAGWQHTSSFVYSERNCHRKKFSVHKRKRTCTDVWGAGAGEKKEKRQNEATSISDICWLVEDSSQTECSTLKNRAQTVTDMLYHCKPLICADMKIFYFLHLM